MWSRFPPRMRKTVTTALDEAAQSGREEATVEDLLIAIARDPMCAAIYMFEQAGISPQTILQRLNATPDRPGGRADRFDAAAMQLLANAQTEADRLRDPHVGTEHIALALAHTNGTPSSQLLNELGFTSEGAEAALRKWIRAGMPRRRSPFERAAAPRWYMRPIAALTRYPRMAWNVFVRTSLGHPGFVSNPYPLYRKLRATQPVRLDPVAPVWVITSYAHTLAMLKDTRFRKDPFAQERLPRGAREQLGLTVSAAARASFEQTSMLFLDPPQHTRIRSIFNKAFTPRRIESLGPRIQAITDRMIDAVAARGEMDLMRDFAAPLPVTVIAELLGFPPADYAKIKKWSDEMTEALGFRVTPQQHEIANRARDEINEYFDTIVAQLRRTPGDNLISALLASDSPAEELKPEELFSNSILLLAAGHETTTNLIGNGMLALLRHPDELRDLRQHPEIMNSAIEELLRYDPAVQWTSRVAGEDMDFGGQPFKRGDIIVASVGAANRDPAVFANPDRLDLRRADNKHLSFGTGVHFCLGAALARMEAQIAFSTLLMRFPNLRLAPGKLKWRKGITFRGVHSLPLRF